MIVESRDAGFWCNMLGAKTVILMCNIILSGAWNGTWLHCFWLKGCNSIYFQRPIVMFLSNFRACDFVVLLQPFIEGW